jgi:hypothetical protein
MHSLRSPPTAASHASRHHNKATASAVRVAIHIFFERGTTQRLFNLGDDSDGWRHHARLTLNRSMGRRMSIHAGGLLGINNPTYMHEDSLVVSDHSEQEDYVERLCPFAGFRN